MKESKIKSAGVGLLIGSLLLISFPFVAAASSWDTSGGMNRFTVQFFPRGGGEWNYILSDGTMGVGEADLLIAAISKDTGMDQLAIQDTLSTGKAITVSASLFSQLKSWGNRPYMGL